jgi:opacity protein-like surface antigen
MRRFFAAAVLLLACSSAAHARQSDTPEWENPRVFGVNKEPAHATFVPYPDEATARRGVMAYAPGAPPAPSSPALIRSAATVRSRMGRVILRPEK